MRSLPVIWSGLKGGLADLRRTKTAMTGSPRTDRDLSMKFVLGGIIFLLIAIMIAPQLNLRGNLIGAVLIVAFGFLFVTVSSRLTGEIGSSSNPISGMTVATLLLTCLVFLIIGWTAPPYFVTALSIGGIVCIAASNGGTTSQDLKTGFLVGSTPKFQQVAILVGALASAVVLGPILGGVATPTESASIGAVGAMLLAARRSGPRAFAARVLASVIYRTAQITSMIFVILIGATLFSLVFRGLGGDEMVRRTLSDLPGGTGGAVLVVMLAMFLLGFVMDAFEIIFVVVPIVAPALLAMPGVDPVWLGVMMALNLQTSYLHPPLGPTLFYLRGVAPPEITTADIYIGVVPFVLIQFLALLVLWFAPGLATWLPHALYGG